MLTDFHGDEAKKNFWIKENENKNKTEIFNSQFICQSNLHTK